MEKYGENPDADNLIIKVNGVGAAEVIDFFFLLSA